MLQRFASSAFVCFCALFFLHAFSVSSYALDQPFDHSVWDQFLKKFVNEEGKVDYAAVKHDPELLNQYQNQLAAIDFKDLFSEKGWPREEKLALFLNAYHMGVVNQVIRHYPVKSIHDIPGVWDTEVVVVALQKFSLNGIRSHELMEAFRDEKIHTALACGAKSCAQFPREAFTGPKVEGQLFLATRQFVNDPERIKVIPGEKKIWLSRLFKWYAPDFQLDFGTTYDDGHGLPREEEAVLSFIVHYLEDQAKIDYLEERNYKVKYLPFDWSLNEWRPAQAAKT